jgi:PD-(D/E)XK nuclease superfamily
MTAGRQLPILSTSERSSFLRCPWQWWHKYRMGYAPKGETADALWFGTGIHIALAEWYQKGKRRGPHPAETFDTWCAGEIRDIKAAYAQGDWEEGSFDDAKYEDAHDLGVDMLEGYVDKYGKDEHWHIIAVETVFRVRVVREGKPVAIFRSAWDGVFRDLRDGEIWVLENKSAKAIQTNYLEHDNQGGSYFAVASAVLRSRGILGPDEKIAGVMYNFLRKSLKDDRPQNETGAYLNMDGSVSKKQPPPRFVRFPIDRSPGEVEGQMTRMANEVFVMNGVRSGAIPLLKNKTRDCTWCEFSGPCKADDRGSPAYQALLDQHYVQSDPYDHYQKSATG